MKTNTRKKLLIIIVVTIVLVTIIVVSLLVFLKDNKKDYIIVVNKSDYTDSEFWEVAYAGMIEAVETTEIKFEYMSPQYEYQIERQKGVILEAIDKKPDAIVLVASDYYEIAPYAKMIAENDIELLLLDSDVNVSYEYKKTYIGTNSVKAGKYLGETAKKNLGDEKAVILSHFKGVQTADDREEGIKQGYGIKNILGTYSCQADEKVAYDYAKNLVSHDESIKILFCTNENVTIGAAKAVEELGCQDRIDIYGFDGSTEHIKFLEMGIVNYTVIQSPYQMGYLSIENALKLLDNKRISKFIETDYLLIDSKNMYELGYREILFPFIK
jgi:ribose transport system substrate-binding protein